MLNIASAVARCRTLTTTVPVLLAIGFVPALAVADTAPAPESPTGGAKTPGAPAAAAGDDAKPAAAPALSPEQQADKDSEAEWARRDAALRETGTLTGGTGLLHMQHAMTGEPGQLRMGFTVEGFSASFLCTNKYPCPPLPGTTASIIGGDTMNHWGGTLSIGTTFGQLGPGMLDGYISTGAYANSDDANKPELLQIMGDTTLGLKYVAPVARTFHLGLFTDVLFINGTGALGLDWGATSARFGGLATVDFRELENPVPLRASFSLDYMLDNTGDVLKSTENTIAAQQGSPYRVPRIERFGLAVNRVDHVDVHLGVEALLLNERIRPFAEYSILAPSNRGGSQYACLPTNQSGDNCLKFDHDVPMTLTLGGRFYPWKESFSVTAGLDIGVAGVGNFIEELAPTAPWTLYVGAGWVIDTQTRPPVVKTKLVEKTIETHALVHHLKGFVHEKDKADPVASAIVSYENHGDLNPIVTNADGRFTSQDLEPGTYTLTVKADGYKPGTCEGTITKEAAESPLDCALEALPRVGRVTGHVRDADTNAPLSSISIHLVDSHQKDVALTTDLSGGFTFENVAPGTAEFHITANGYLAFVGPTEVKARQDANGDVFIRAKPKTSEVKVEGKEITIRHQIQFALDSAVILPESFGLLSEIADSLIRETRIRRLEVQGHTDNSGSPEHNKTLSEQRAEAVRAWLVQHGVAASRIVAQGYGQEKPLVPNVTPTNRGKNRRVQFIILDQDSATPPVLPSPAGKK